METMEEPQISAHPLSRLGLPRGPLATHEPSVENGGRTSNSEKNRDPAALRIDSALKREREMWASMFAAFLSGKRGRLKRLISIYVTSYDVRLAHAYRANRKNKKRLRLPLRELPAIAYRVNLLEPCDELVHVVHVPRASGGTREITVPGILNKIGSMIFASVLRIARNAIPQNAFYTGNSGVKAAREEVVKMVEEPDKRWFVENDIRDYFGSFNDGAVVELIREILPVDSRVIRNVALASNLNYQRPPRRRRRVRGGRTNFLRTRNRPRQPTTRRQTGTVPHPVTGCNVRHGDHDRVHGNGIYHASTHVSPLRGLAGPVCRRAFLPHP